MKVSVVIPVYNAEKYLDECINSVLSQSYNDIEIIAVNDGSTDSCLSILNKYKNDIIIIDKKNGGTASALNAGIKKMSGEWFKWISADDLLKKNAIEVLIEECKKLGEHSHSLILYSNYDIINQYGEKIHEVIEPDYNKLDDFQRNVILLDHFYGNGDTTLMHKSLFEKCGLFDESIRFKDDYEFWLRCCLIYGYRLYLIPQNLAMYRIHQEQLTKKNYDDALEKINIIKSSILAKLPHNIQEKYKTALKDYQKQKPISVQTRRFFRDLMFKVLPKNTSSKILEMYLNNKKI